MNRFYEINNYIMKQENDSSAILVRRQFDTAENSGMIRNIVTDIRDSSHLSEDERKIVVAGVPQWDVANAAFYEPFFKQQRIIILGAGHIAVMLSMLAKMIGMHVIVIDDRADFADAKRFPYADEVICSSFYDGIDRVKPCKTDYVVIITRGHANDIECLESLMNYEETVYTGLMGSKRRVTTVLQQLKDMGYDAARLDRIHSPIGLNIGAKTIEEIDISIISEIIKVRRIDSVLCDAVDRGDHDYGELLKLAEINLPCSVATILSAEGSTPRSAGAVMAVFADGTIIGSIGGGCAEAAVIHRAKSIIGTGKYEIMKVSLDNKSAMQEGMICGGTIDVLVEDFPI